MRFLRLLKRHRRTQSDSEMVSVVPQEILPCDSPSTSRARSVSPNSSSLLENIVPAAINAMEATTYLEDEERLLRARLTRLEAETALLTAEVDVLRVEGEIGPTEEDAVEIAKLEQRLAHYDWTCILFDALDIANPSAEDSITERFMRYVIANKNTPTDPFIAIRDQLAAMVPSGVVVPSLDYSRAVDISLAARRKERDARKMYIWWRNKVQEILGEEHQLVTPSNSVLGIDQVEGRITPTISTASVGRIQREWGYMWGADLESRSILSLPSAGSFPYISSMVTSTSREIVLASSVSRELVPASTSRELVLASSSSKELVLAPGSSRLHIPASSTSRELIHISASRELVLASSASKDLVLSATSKDAIFVSSSSNSLVLATPSSSHYLATSTRRRPVPTSSSSGSLVSQAVRCLSLIAAPQPSTATIRLLCSPSSAPFPFSNVSTAPAVLEDKGEDRKKQEEQDESWVDILVPAPANVEEVESKDSDEPVSIRAVNFTPAAEGTGAPQVEVKVSTSSRPDTPTPQMVLPSLPKSAPATMRTPTKTKLTLPRARPAFMSLKGITKLIPGKSRKRESVVEMSFECVEKPVVEYEEKVQAPAKIGGSVGARNEKRSWRRSLPSSSARGKENANVLASARDREERERKEAERKGRRASWRKSWVGKEGVPEKIVERKAEEKLASPGKSMRRLSRLPTLRRGS